MFLEPRRPTEKSVERLLRPSELEIVRQKPVALYRVDKSLGRLLSPGIECFRLAQLVERVVDLDRVERPGVMLEPAVDRQVFWIKQAAPMLIVPAGGADADRALHATGSASLCLPSGFNTPQYELRI